MRIKTIVSTLIGVVVSAGALYFAFRNVPFSDLLIFIRVVDYRWVIPAVGTVILISLLRSLRWQFILKSVDTVGFWDAHHPLMIGFMTNCILPGRVGELARPAVLARRSAVPYAAGLATVGLERAMDALFLIAAFALMVSHLSIDPGFESSFGGYRLTPALLNQIGTGLLKLCILMMVGIAFISIDVTRKWLQRCLRGMPRLIFFMSHTAQNRIVDRIISPMNAWLDQLAVGLGLIKSPKTLIITTGLTILIWFLSALSYYLVALGCPGLTIGFVDHMVAMIIVCFCIALPSVPGFWGIWEAGGVFALTLLGVGVDEAAGYTLLNHVIQIVPVILMGWASALITGVSIMTIATKRSSASVEKP